MGRCCYHGGLSGPPPPPSIDDLDGHGAPSALRPQARLRTVVNGVRFTAFRDMLWTLSATAVSAEEESASEASARHLSLCLRALPMNPCPAIPPLECVSTLRRVLGFETCLAQCEGTGCRKRATSTCPSRRCLGTGGAAVQRTYGTVSFVACGRWVYRCGLRTPSR